MSSGIEAELETLCRSCGLCCDGALFGAVTLAYDEVASAQKSRLRVLPRGGSFEQPCSALAPDGGCSIYADRPRACRTFTCRLYERHGREGGRLEERLEAVRRVRELLALLERTSDEHTRHALTNELRQRMDDFARAESPST